MKKFKFFLMISFHLCFLSNFESRAESSLEEEMKTMKIQLEAMQKKIEQLEAKVVSQQNQLDEQPPSMTSQSVSTKPSMTKWLPEIGVVADAVYTQDSSKTDTEGSDRLSLRELELVLGSAVDPFSRLDATISFSDTEDTSLEEAYLTRFGLPFETTARLGKFKPKVGKVLGVHRDSLDTVDEPLVIQRYFGAEGYNKSGVDFSKTLNLPWAMTHQVTIGVLEGGNGDGGTIFGSARRTPTAYGHLKNYIDLTDATGLEFGFSDLIGSRDDSASGFETHVLGLDTTLMHHFNSNQNIKLQGEAFNVHRKQTFDADSNIWGSYGLVDLRFHPQWSTGFRCDYVELVDNIGNPGKADQGLSGYLTFYQSEFARWRIQATHKNLTTGKDDNAVYLQGAFAIGEHKHKIQ